MTTKLTELVRTQEREYGREDGVLRGYLTLMSGYSGGVLAAVMLARRLGVRAPDRLTPWQLLQLGVATHKIARLITKDSVTSALRAPVTEFVEPSAPGELHEDVRGHGLKHSAGELLTCPMCIGQWVATGLVGGLTFAPTSTRVVVEVFDIVALSDFLQHLYVAAQKL